MFSKLQQALHQASKKLRLAWFNLMLGAVSFDEEMDCYWQGHEASMQNPQPCNQHVHPVRREAFDAGVAMERWSLESDSSAPYAHSLVDSGMRTVVDDGHNLELQPST